MGRSQGPRWLRLAFGGALCAVIVAGVSPACAHTEMGTGGGLLSGFTHPIFGFDHLVAMVAVGLWGAFLGAPAIWTLPIVFPMVMVLGGLMGIMGVPVPAGEFGVAASAIVLGIMVTFTVKPPLWIAAAMVGAFAIFHGQAHGRSLLGAADPLGYAIGFVVATGLLHVGGIAFGLLARWPVGRLVVRALGGVIAAVGVAFLAAFS